MEYYTTESKDSIDRMSPEEWDKLLKRFSDAPSFEKRMVLSTSWSLFLLMILNDPKIPDSYITNNLVLAIAKIQKFQGSMTLNLVREIKDYIDTAPIFPAPLSRFNLLFPLFQKSTKIRIREIWIPLLKSYPQWQSILRANPRYPLDEISWERSQGKTPHLINYLWNLDSQDIEKWKLRFGDVIDFSCEDVNNLMQIPVSRFNQDSFDTLLKNFQFKNQCTSPKSQDLLSIASLLRSDPKRNIFFTAVLEGRIEPNFLLHLIEISHLTRQQKEELLNDYDRWLQFGQQDSDSDDELERYDLAE
jgi:hypothetical protein